METLQKDIVSMKQQKMTLFVSTTTFRRNLLDLLGMQTEEVFIHSDKSLVIRDTQITPNSKSQ